MFSTLNPLSMHRHGAVTPRLSQFRDDSNRAKLVSENTVTVEMVCRMTPDHGSTLCVTVLDENIASTFTGCDTHPDINNMVLVEGAREAVVGNNDEALHLFCKGEQWRSVSDTILNKESSRSHSVFTIHLVMVCLKESCCTSQPDCNPDGFTASQLSLVDLTGSQRKCQPTRIAIRCCQCAILESSGNIRMTTCTKLEPADFEENLNVLAFAEESQTLHTTRANDC